MDILDQIQELKEKILNAARKPNSKQLAALQEKYPNFRAYGLRYTDDELIFVGNNANNHANYYAGLEYVDSEYITQVGDLTIYFAGDDDQRINAILDILLDNEE